MKQWIPHHLFPRLVEVLMYILASHWLTWDTKEVGISICMISCLFVHLTNSIEVSFQCADLTQILMGFCHRHRNLIWLLSQTYQMLVTRSISKERLLSCNCLLFINKVMKLKIMLSTEMKYSVDASNGIQSSRKTFILTKKLFDRKLQTCVHMARSSLSNSGGWVSLYLILFCLARLLKFVGGIEKEEMCIKLQD